MTTSRSWSAQRAAGHFANTRGISLIEVMIAAVVFIFVAFGAGSLYLSAERAFDYSSAETFLQRQGTAVQERLTSELRSANSVQIARCREIAPTASPVMPANKSLIYTLYYPARTTNQTEYWCIYEYQRSAFSPFAQIWKCPLADATADQTCTGGSANTENLLPPVPSSVAGQRVEVAQTAFCSSGISPCDCPVGVICIAPRSVDIRFELNLYPGNTTASFMYGPRRFGFSVAYRN